MKNRPLGILAAFLIGLSAAHVHAAPPGKTQNLTSPEQVPEGLAKSEWSSIRAAYEAGRHACQPTATGWQARNPGQQWTTKFDGRGFLAEPRDGGWQWGLELQSYGFGENQTAIGGTPAVKAEGQRLTYQWDAAVQEWWVNDARGLEHGFTVKERPATIPTGLHPLAQGCDAGATLGQTADRATTLKGLQPLAPDAATSRDDATPLGLKVSLAGCPRVARASQPWAECWNPFGIADETDSEKPPLHSQPSTLSFLLATRGTLHPRVSADALGVLFKDDSGATVISYSGLKVWDADGKVLASHFAPAEGGVRLLVEECGARYPLTIDPIAQQAYLKPAAVGTSQVNDKFGSSVAVSGDTVVVGAPGEDSSTTGVDSTPIDAANASGAAYVFVRSAGVWTQQAYLKPAAVGTSQAVDGFGVSVAVSGDTVVVGAPGEDSSTTGVDSTPNDSGIFQNGQFYFDSGAAYVFVRSGTNWTQQAYLKPAAVGTTQEADKFGSSVAVSGDTVVVGASLEDSSTTGVNSTPNESAVNSGAAYIYQIPSCCGNTVFTGPILTNLEAQAAYGWHAVVEKSVDDGLVIRDLKLFDRDVAERISVPYFEILTTGMQSQGIKKQRGELRPNDPADTKLRSRLVDFTTTTNGIYSFVIEATYRIDEIPGSPGSGLCIIQRYEFLSDYGAAILPFEPSGELDARVVRPIVRYCFDGANGDTIVDLHIPQRHAFWLDHAPNNSTGVFEDKTFFEYANGTVYFGFVQKLIGNPLPIEVAGTAIVRGKHEGPARWDNIHVTFTDTIQEPILDLDEYAPPHAAVEAIHMHWRWSPLADGSFIIGGVDFDTDGKPLIPPGSDQDLAFAIVRYHAGAEEDPVSFLDLVDVVPESLNSGRQVVWLGATGHQKQDTFFAFGFGLEETNRYATGDLAG